MKFNIFKFDIAEIIIGLFLLFITFDGYLRGYQGYEGRHLFGIMLSLTYIMGSFVFIDGVDNLRKRYNADKKYWKKYWGLVKKEDGTD